MKFFVATTIALSTLTSMAADARPRDCRLVGQKDSGYYRICRYKCGLLSRAARTVDRTENCPQTIEKQR